MSASSIAATTGVTAPPPAPIATPVSPPAATLAATAAAPSGAFAAAQGGPTPPASNLVQVAAVTEVSRGRELQRQLREAGFDAYWESVRSKKGEVVRVRVSVDNATQTMAETIARLKAMGFDPIIVTP
jgi:cell division septation protein DedD